MKTPKFVAPILIVISLFTIWRGLTADFPANDETRLLNPASRVVASSGINGYLEPVEIVASPSSFTSMSAQQPNDPYLGEQWALEQIQASELWQTTTGSSQILVAVLDTGINQEHEDLNGQVVGGINFTSSPTMGDFNGHGTHVAGVIAANSNNGLGIVGLAPESRLLNVKVADDKGECCISAVAAGIIWAVNNGASVINISLQFTEPSPELESAVNFAWNNGAVIIAAAGNNSGDHPVYPAAYENCIAVTSIRQDNALAPLANHGDWVDVAAPGVNIYATQPHNSYGYQNGTSFASAYVSGLAALLFAVATDADNNGRLNDEVRLAVEAGCQEIGIDGVGKGRIDAANSMAEIIAAGKPTEVLTLQL